MLLSRILSVVNSDWLQHARCVCRVYELVVLVKTKYYKALKATSFKWSFDWAICKEREKLNFPHR